MPELSTGALVAIMLIVTSVVISVVFTVLGFIRSATSEGMTSMQNSLDAMTLSQFDEYDQQQMKGSRVISALKLQEGKPLAMVVVNKKPNSSVAAASPTKTLFDDQGADTVWTGKNYGALLKGVPTTGDETVIYTLGFKTTTDEEAAHNEIVASGGIARSGTLSHYLADIQVSSDNSMIYNHNKVNTTRSGHDEYIRPTAIYTARLVKDTTGSIVGAVFVQSN